MSQLQILILDDDEEIRREIKEFFVDREYRVFTAGLPSEAFAILEQQAIDVILLDMKLPEMEGLDVLKRIKTDFLDIEVIMITGHGDTRSIVEAMRLGAFDFFTKPFRMLDVQAAIQRTHKFLALQQQLKTVKTSYALVLHDLQQRLSHPIIGKSQAIQSVLELMSRVAQTDDTSVLITGESGTGKELVARGIHALSQRAAHYFCEVNCSAIPESLFESEMFGHTKGAFTGASDDQMGCFEAAHKGTLFLDEIGDIPAPCQMKLLKVIEGKAIKRLGSQKEIVVDLRIISATNQDLDALVQAHSFRLDLLHRLKMFVIHLIPLRERPDDIPLLLDYYTSYFAKKFRKPITGIEPATIRQLRQYPFPGNVRKLQNMVERAVILCDENRLAARHFSFPAPHEQETLPVTISEENRGKK
jgi:DNA-binding NtrC family response regulator